MHLIWLSSVLVMDWLTKSLMGLGNAQMQGKAFSKIAVAQVPCGSGNRLSHNLNGTGTVSKATLVIIKGIRKPLDLISITQGDRRILSFLSQATGTGAESDLATEPLRWMGDTRFKIGFLTRILAQKVSPLKGTRTMTDYHLSNTELSKTKRQKIGW